MRQILIYPGEYDELIEDSIKLVQEVQKASATLIQNKFNIGYARSARILDELVSLGIVGPSRGSRPRKVLVKRDEELKLNKFTPKNKKDKPRVVPKKYKEMHDDYLRKSAAIIERSLDCFGITARVAEVNNRPNDIEFAIEVALGTRIADILALENDMAMALAVPPELLVIEAPIPGRSLIGIRVPYPNYESWETPKFLPPKEEKKRNSQM